MSKIICENARGWVPVGETKNTLRIECEPDCEICHGQCYVEEVVVNVSEVSEVWGEAIQKNLCDRPYRTIEHFDNWLAQKEQEDEG